MKNSHSYKRMKYNKKQIAIANIDKLSFHKRGSRRTYTPFGTVTLYSNENGKRLFSVSHSKKLANAGSYTFRSLKMKIDSL